MTIREAIDNVISHNAQVAILEVDKEDRHYSNIVWKGMAHSIPEKYQDREFKPISDYVNYDTHVVDHPIHLELKEDKDLKELFNVLFTEQYCK